MEERLRSGPLDIEEAMAVFRPLAEALAVAHAAKVVHGNLKPGNIRIAADGVIKLLDFRLARVLGEMRPTGSVSPPTKLAKPGPAI